MPHIDLVIKGGTICTSKAFFKAGLAVDDGNDCGNCQGGKSFRCE